MRTSAPSVQSAVRRGKGFPSVRLPRVLVDVSDRIAVDPSPAGRVREVPQP